MYTNPAKLSSPKITLLIDDEPDVRKILFNLLTAEYGESLLILQADSGQVAIEIINGVKVDIIISDFDMPNGSGLTVYSHLKKSKQFPNFIFFSGAKNLHLYLPKMDSFFQGIILKPNFSAVVEKVGNWLDVGNATQ